MPSCVVLCLVNVPLLSASASNGYVLCYDILDLLADGELESLWPWPSSLVFSFIRICVDVSVFSLDDPLWLIVVVLIEDALHGRVCGRLQQLVIEYQLALRRRLIPHATWTRSQDRHWTSSLWFSDLDWIFTELQLARVLQALCRLFYWNEHTNLQQGFSLTVRCFIGVSTRVATNRHSLFVCELDDRFGQIVQKT